MYRTHHFVRLSTIVNGRARGKVFSPAPICRSLSTLDKLYPRHDSFSERHIGPGADEKGEMLDFLGFKNMKEMITKTVPASILMDRELR
ncbi:Hypothetical predicted protein [Mytilus galloprovincialis]|uniref:Uncharacterized protein n=1 Tax=Mytilus galloprovincialis TaxID=29158 RepID=A0A8B6E7T2_MYTGA|nr:Hypothetical predicted protein [Mytilus galloprovincialis]